MPRLSTDYTGTVQRTEGVLMGPFGDNFTETLSTLDFTGFAGGFWDSENNGEHFGAREYQNTHGSWLSPDPAGLKAVDITNPQTWNRYAYVLNNPVIYTDPSGLDCTYNNPDGSQTIVRGDCLDPTDNGVYTDCDGCLMDLAVTADVSDVATTDSDISGSIGYADAANNDPQTGVPANPCASAGSAQNPSVYAAAGTIAQVSTFLSPAGSLVNAAYLFSFRRGGALDAQPFGASRAYGNYVFGAYLSAAGIPLSVGLTGANGYAAVSNAQYPGFTMDPNYPAIPQANVANIVNGYNAQRNGTLCHK